MRAKKTTKAKSCITSKDPGTPEECQTGIDVIHLCNDNTQIGNDGNPYVDTSKDTCLYLNAR